MTEVRATPVKSAGRGPRRGTSVRRLPQPGDALIPFAPLLYVAWADGELSRAELAAIQQKVAGFTDLPADTRAELQKWLDPANPPAAADLAALLAALRGRGAALTPDARRSLADAGAALLPGGKGGEGAAVRRALNELDSALGMAGAEALRGLLPPVPDGEAPGGVAAAPAVPAFDPGALYSYLDAYHIELRARVFELLTSPDFDRPLELDRAAHREQTLAWCRELADAGISGLGFPEEFGGRNDPTQAVTAFETLAYHDLSMLVKFGVQFGLFGGSIYMLGTRRHHEKYLRAVATLELPGCYAMSETGHGSNVREIETTARYDHETGEFVIHTPNRQARKDYIGNAALHGRMATVFAQLEAEGEQHGVHAFLVPIRDDGGAPAAGVEIEDCGPKIGLNGVDNGRLRFDNVRIPRENLLDRFGTVGEDGSYQSPINSSSRRFFTMLGTLVAGRISIAAAAVSASKSGLAVAVRYTASRRQFGPEGGEEVPVLRYRAVQRALLPRLAATYALHFTQREVIRRFGQADGDVREIESAAAGLKAYASRHTVDTLQACREACGGQGYLSENRFDALKADTDVFTTFEGANDVLLQLVVKGMLTELREQFSELRLWSGMRYVARRTRKALAALNPVLPRRTDPEHLDDPDFHAAAFAYRRERLLISLARRLKQRIDDGLDSFDALNDCQDHALATANAQIEAMLYEHFQRGVEACPDPLLRAPLRRLATLFALSCLHNDRGWFLESGYFEPAKARAVRRRLNDHCASVAPEAVALVDAFGIPEKLLAAPIARR